VTLLLVNGGSDEIEFVLPALPCQWYLRLDTAADRPGGAEIRAPEVPVHPHGLIVLANNQGGGR